MEFPDCHVNGRLVNNYSERDIFKNPRKYIKTCIELNRPKWIVTLDKHFKRKSFKKWFEERYELV
jgi:hypothetical protein